MFALSENEIRGDQTRMHLSGHQAGAQVIFEGRVRNQNEGRRVTGLDYEAFKPLAEKEGNRILTEARDAYAVLSVTCIHRTGSMALGDLAVWVAVTAMHRDAAFTACRYIIDEVKKRVPIWKKETYADGDSKWVNAAPDSGTKL